jgi:hypothetical protein
LRDEEGFLVVKVYLVVKLYELRPLRALSVTKDVFNLLIFDI